MKKKTNVFEDKSDNESSHVSEKFRMRNNFMLGLKRKEKNRVPNSKKLKHQSTSQMMKKQKIALKDLPNYKVVQKYDDQLYYQPMSNSDFIY